MTQELIRAKELLKSDISYTLAAVNGDQSRTSTARGVKPLIELLNGDSDFLKGASIADKVTGAASAFILVLGKVKELYTDVISEPATEILKKYGIHYVAATTVSGIINRQGNGSCPMEAAVKGIEEPEQALQAILDKIAELSAKSDK